MNTYVEAKLFEEEVTNVLVSRCSEEENILKEVSLLPGNFRADLYLPNGCKALGWSRKTVIEIKLVLRYSSISQIYQLYYPLYKKDEISKLIIIYRDSNRIDGLDKFLASFDVKFIDSLNINDLKKVEAIENGNERKNEKFFDKIDVIDKAKDAFNNT